MSRIAQAPPAAASAAGASTQPGRHCGRTAQLVAAGMTGPPEARVLHFTLLFEPAGPGDYSVEHWPQIADAALAEHVFLRAAPQIDPGVPVGSVQPTWLEAKPRLRPLVGRLDPRAREWWRRVMGGGPYPVWHELHGVLRGDEPPDPPRAATGSSALEEAWRADRVARARARLRGEPEPPVIPWPSSLQDRVAVGRGWDAPPPRAAIAEAVRQARALGQAERQAREAWEVARLRDPARAFAELADPPPTRLAALGGLVPPRLPELPRPDPRLLFLAADPPVPRSETDLKRAARLRWSQLLTQPSLLRLFGLAVDYEVPLAALGAPTPAFWLFQPELVGAPEAAGDVWSLAKLDAAAGSFWPCLCEEVDDPRWHPHLAMHDGFANLQQTLVISGKRRYRLSTADGLSGLAGQGGNPGGTERGPGLVLLDTHPAADAIACDAACTADAAPIRVQDAKLLRMGWQLDIRLGEGEAGPWHSLMQRQFRYALGRDEREDRALEAAITARYGGADAAARRIRAEAAAIDSPPLEKDESPAGALMLHQDIVAHWTGRPMGVTLVEHEAGERIPVRANELAIGTEEDVPGRIPPLRAGRRYAVRLRAVFRGGVGPALGATMPGGAALGPIVFRREEPILAPMVLHIEADLRRDSTSVDAPAGAGSQESFLRLPGQAPLPRAPDLVLRPALRLPREPEATRRVLLPPVVPLALADRLAPLAAAPGGQRVREGLLGADYSSGGAAGKLNETGRGGWPGMRVVGNSTIALERFAQLPLSETPAPREPVFRAGPADAPRAVELLPDPHAQRYRLALRWPGGTRPFGALELPVYAGTRYPDPRPLVLEVAPREAADGRPPSLEIVPGGTTLPFSPFRTEDRRAQLVRLRLAPGEEVDILAWCPPPREALISAFQLWADLEGAEPLDRWSDPRAALLDMPDEGIAGVTVLKAAHAATALDAAATPLLSQVPVAAWRQQKEQKGAEILELQGAVYAPLRRVAGLRIEVAGVGLVTGRFDDPENRGRSREERAAGIWPTDGRDPMRPRASADVLGFAVAMDGTASLAVERATVLSLDGPPPERAWGGTALTEARLESFTAEWPGAIRDGRARRLTLTPIALPGAAALLTDRQGDPLVTTELRGASRSLWLPARRRPTAPLTPWVVPAFEWVDGTQREGPAVWSTLRRIAVPRIRLGRPWFSSGEGEMLGVILWPPHLPELNPAEVDRDLIRRAPLQAPPDYPPVDGSPPPPALAYNPPPAMNLAGLEDLDLGLGSAFVTRWGDDPVREPSSLMPLLLSTENFARATAEAGWQFVSDAQVPLGRADDAAISVDARSDEMPSSWLRACLLVTTPRFDPDLEEWYADLPVQVAGSIEPFLRLGLVRWQPHAPPELRCSLPAVAWTQLVPERTLRWRRKGQGKAAAVETEVRGPATRLADIPSELGDGTNPGLMRPVMRFGLLRREVLADGGHGETPCCPDQTGFAALAPLANRRHGGLAWSTTLPLPDAVDGATYHLTVEEIEQRLAATPPPWRAGETGQDHVSDSGPRFAARVAV